MRHRGGAAKDRTRRLKARASVVVCAASTAALAAVMTLGAAPPAAAQMVQELTKDELAYGRYLAQECANCHRLGESYDGGHYSGVPSITGLPPEELLAKLRDKGSSANAILRDTLKTLTDDQLELIVRYLATIPAE